MIGHAPGGGGGDILGQIDFDMSATFERFSGFARFSLADPQKPIERIRLVNAYGIKLGDLIQAFGSPNYVRGCKTITLGTNLSEWYLEIIWIPKGFSISDNLLTPLPMIDQNLALSGANIFPPSLDDYRNLFTEKWLKPWHGYDNVSGYFEDDLSKNNTCY